MALATVLVLIAVTSSTVAAFSTANYFQFYTALGQLQLNLKSLAYKTVGNLAEANITFTLDNPTEYRGISMLLFEPNFVVNASGETVTRPLGLSIVQEISKLDPGKIVRVAFPFNSTWNQSWQNAQFVFTVNINLSTFLDQAASISTTYLCVSGGSPSTCEQVAVRIQGTGGFHGGGGGGGF